MNNNIIVNSKYSLITFIQSTERYQKIQNLLNYLKIKKMVEEDFKIECDITYQDMFSINAYITTNKIIFLYPQFFINRKITNEMIIFVIGHEIGHYELHHFDFKNDNISLLKNQEHNADLFSIVEFMIKLKININTSIDFLKLLDKNINDKQFNSTYPSINERIELIEKFFPFI